MKTSITHTLLVIACAVSGLLASHAVHANDRDYLQKVQVPKELPPADAVPSQKAVYYLKTPDYFGSELVPSDDARLKAKTSGDTSVFVQFKSAVVAATIEEQLKLRGFKIAPTRAAADLVLGGDIVYQDQFFPNAQRRLTFNEKMDPASSMPGAGNKTVSLAALQLAPTYLASAGSPSAFGAALLFNLFEVTGANKLFAGPADQKNAESFLMLDCFDKVTRKSTSCIGDDQLLLSYRGKVRVQAIDVKAYLTKPGGSASDFQRARIISRALDGRGVKEVRTVELLADAVQELVSGLGNEPAKLDSADVVNPAPVPVLQAEPAAVPEPQK